MKLYKLKALMYEMNRQKLIYILSCAAMLVLSNFVYAQEELAYDTKNKRNPFVPLVTSDGRILKLEEDEADKKVILEGIIYDRGGLSYAVVNGSIVKIGESVDGYQVLKIEDNKVVFIKNGQTLEVILKKEEK